jgi:hypothetical protein
VLTGRLRGRWERSRESILRVPADGSRIRVRVARRDDLPLWRCWHGDRIRG